MSAEEEKAIKAIEELGGFVKRDSSKPGNPVTEVRCPGIQRTDAALKEIAVLKNLNELDLHNNELTDGGLKELAR